MSRWILRNFNIFVAKQTLHKPTNMKRLMLFIMLALLGAACAEEAAKPSVEQQLDEFNRRAERLAEVIDLGSATGLMQWYTSLDEAQQIEVQKACGEYAALRKEMSEWRRGLSQEEQERVTAHMREASKSIDMRRIEYLNTLSSIVKSYRAGEQQK